MQREIPLIEKIVAVSSYMTLGFIGMIWFIFNFVIIKKPLSRFLNCNLVQSFVLSIVYAIFTLALNIFVPILIRIPFLGALILKLHIFIFATPIYYSMSLFHFVIVVFLSYLSLFALFGKLPFIPFITDITKRLYDA